MKKKKKAPKPSPTSVLDSGNWVSESSARSRSGSGSGSGSSGPPCKDCHINFLQDEVEVAWAEGGIYPASSNLDPSGGGWNPDLWSLEVIDGAASVLASFTDATIDSATGGVTFGSIGQSLAITAGVRRCIKCKKKMTLHVAKLQIEYEDPKGNPPWSKTDVADKQTTVEIGNFIALSAVVTPKALAPANGKYNWDVPGGLLKNYLENRAADPVVPLPNGELKNGALSFHWVDGGSKDVSVSATIKALELQAVSTFDVSFPVATVTDGVFSQPAVQNGIPAKPPPNPQPANPNGWILQCGNVLFVRNGEETEGKFVWAQMLNFLQTAVTVNGQTTITPPPNANNGLDAGFPYSGDSDGTEDAPTMNFNVNTASWAQYSLRATMYLMFLSKQQKSRYVAVWAVDWETQATANSNAAFPNPADYTITADSGTRIVNSRFETDPPNWKRIVQ